MTTSLTCSCGAKLKVSDKAAGMAVKCPKCSAVVKVPAPVACSDAQVLRQFLLGQATEPSAEQIEQHLEQCDRCVETLRGLHSEDTLVAALRQGQSEQAVNPVDEQVEKLIERICTLRPAAAALAEAATVGGAPNAPAPESDTDGGEELYDFLAPPQGPDEIGRLGSYRILKVLGAGGMGVVFQAEDPQLERLVALKAMMPALAASATAKKRFLREAKSAAAIKHDHIVSIYQVGEDRGVPFLAMEFLTGEALAERLEREARLPLADVHRIGREVASGLAAAHESGMIHRDIKPGNLWLEGPRGRVKILDFGLARTEKDDAQLTKSGAIVGTPAFMAPEQAEGKAVDARCDLFSLGCVLYRMSTGQLPFKGTDTMSTLLALVSDDPAPPREVNPEVPPALSDLVMRLLAKNPAHRPESAQAVVRAIEAMERGTASLRARPSATAVTASPPMSPAMRPRKPVRRRVVLVAAALAAAAATLLAGVIVLRLHGGEGTVTIETLDPDVEVRIKKDGREVAILDLKTKKEVTLPVGPYEAELIGGKEGITLETREFTLKRGKKELIRVTMRPKDDKVIASPTIALPKTFTNSLGMEFVLVPKGRSWLGGGDGKPGDEEVEIVHDFYLGKYVVTQEEWEKVMGSNPSLISRRGAGKVAVKAISDADLNRFQWKTFRGMILRNFFDC